MRPPGRHHGAVDLQLGVRQGPAPRPPSRGHRRPANPRQEGRRPRTWPRGRRAASPGLGLASARPVRGACQAARSFVYLATSANQSALLTDVFYALAPTPTRRAIVGALGRGPASVSALAAPFAMALPIVHEAPVGAGDAAASSARARPAGCGPASSGPKALAPRRSAGSPGSAPLGKRAADRMAAFRRKASSGGTSTVRHETARLEALSRTDSRHHPPRRARRARRCGGPGASPSSLKEWWCPEALDHRGAGLRPAAGRRLPHLHARARRRHQRQPGLLPRGRATGADRLHLDAARAAGGPATPWMPIHRDHHAWPTKARARATSPPSCIPTRRSCDRHKQMGFFDGWNTCIDQLAGLRPGASGDLSPAIGDPDDHRAAPFVGAAVAAAGGRIMMLGQACIGAHEDAMREPFELVHHNRYPSELPSRSRRRTGTVPRPRRRLLDRRRGLRPRPSPAARAAALPHRRRGRRRRPRRRPALARRARGGVPSRPWRPSPSARTGRPTSPPWPNGEPRRPRSRSR